MAGSPLEIASSWGLRSGHELDADPEGQAAVHCPPPPRGSSLGQREPWRRWSRGGASPGARQRPCQSNPGHLQLVRPRSRPAFPGCLPPGLVLGCRTLGLSPGSSCLGLWASYLVSAG